MKEPSNSEGEALPSDKRPTPQAKWKMKNPKAIWAHAALRSAIRKGLITRKNCEVCGDPATDGHHEDYDRPMLVRWLCRKHHREQHHKR